MAEFSIRLYDPEDYYMGSIEKRTCVGDSPDKAVRAALKLSDPDWGEDEVYPLRVSIRSELSRDDRDFRVYVTRDGRLMLNRDAAEDAGKGKT